MAYTTRKKDPKKAKQQIKKPQAPKLRAKKGKPKFVFFLGDEGGILVMMQGRMVVRRLFAADPSEESMAPLIDLMEDHPHAPLSVLVDMMDQSYVRHTLPPVSPLSVNKLVQRRLDRDFAPEDVKGAISLGREKVGRKDWNFLLVALPNSPVLQQWFAILLEMPNRFEGVYLTPVECQEYIKALEGTVKREKDLDPAQWQLLVSHHKVGGFRQVVLKDGKLVFTRLTQSVGAELPEVVAGNVEQEILNTIEYLRRLSYNEKAGLDVYIVVSAEIKDLVDATKFNALQMVRMTPSEVSDALKLPQSALSGDRFGDVVISAAFAVAKKRAMRLLPRYVKKLNLMYMASAGVKAVAALAVLGLLGYGAMSYLDKGDAEQQMQELASRQSEAQSALDQVKERMLQLGDDEVLRNASAAVLQEINPYAYRPIDFTRELLNVINPEALVQSLNWTLEGSSLSDQNQNFASNNNEPEEPPVTAEVVFETEGHEGSVVAFTRIADELMERVVENVVDYQVERQRLVGQVQDNEAISITLEEEIANQQLSEDEDDVLLTFKGPKPDEDSAQSGFAQGRN